MEKVIARSKWTQRARRISVFFFGNLTAEGYISYPDNQFRHSLEGLRPFLFLSFVYLPPFGLLGFFL